MDCGLHLLHFTRCPRRVALQHVSRRHDECDHPLLFETSGHPTLHIRLWNQSRRRQNILRIELEKWNRSSTAELQRRGIQWDFITPRTPHYGGVWERIVGLFKRHLAAISTGAVLHVDTFHTAVIEVEGILNRRPLTALSTDPNDTDALTPNHILCASAYGDQPLDLVRHGVDVDAESTRVRWKRAQGRVDAFWKIWRNEYLSLLHARSKWTKSEKDFVVDDLVIIVDEALQRHEWCLGRVVHVEGSASHVRRVHVLRKDGKIVKKDRTKVVHLELDSQKNG